MSDIGRIGGDYDGRNGRYSEVDGPDRWAQRLIEDSVGRENAYGVWIYYRDAIASGDLVFPTKAVEEMRGSDGIDLELM
jgi:hypothetical protein